MSTMKTFKLLIIICLFLMFSPIVLANEEENTDPVYGYVEESTETTETIYGNYPDSVTGQQFKGTGTAVDYELSNGKEFYTITTDENETYYLIIDNEKNADNVYFLREINDQDLNTSLTQNQNNSSNSINIDNINSEKIPTNNSALYVGIFFLAVVGVGYYIKIYKPKMDKKKIEEGEKANVKNENVEEGDEYEIEDYGDENQNYEEDNSQ